MSAGNTTEGAQQVDVSLRDRFAMQALPVMLRLEDTAVWNQSVREARRGDSAAQVARACYLMADAMLKARQQ